MSDKLLNVNVKVPNQGLLIMDPISGGGIEWKQQFEFMLDNKNVECKMEGTTNLGYSLKDKGFCYIDATKGKHVLSIKYAKKMASKKKASIDMIVGV